MITPTPYIVLPADRSKCTGCGKQPVLLTRIDGESPSFYVCHACGFIGQVGTGPVRRYDQGGTLPRHALTLTTIAKVADR